MTWHWQQRASWSGRGIDWSL